MKLDFFCVAEKVEIGPDNTPVIHGLLKTIAAPQFPVTTACVMCCIVIGTSDERPEHYTLNFTLENEQGELQTSQFIGVRSNHVEDYSKPIPFRSEHVLPPTKLTFKAPGVYTVHMTLEDRNALEQTITVRLQP